MHRPQKKKGPRDPHLVAYLRLIPATAIRLRAWLLNNPQASPLVQFNYPPGTNVIAALPQAVLAHYVTVNPDAGRMIEEIDASTGHELTLYQFREAWENIDKLAPLT